MVPLLAGGVANGGPLPASSIRGFKALDVDTVKEYLLKRADLCKLVGPSGSQASWTVRTRPPPQNAQRYFVSIKKSRSSALDTTVSFCISSACASHYCPPRHFRR